MSKNNNIEKTKNILSRFINWIKNNRLKSFLFIFILGILMRFICLGIYLSTVTADWVDMNEKIWIALSEYLINGINPYGQHYEMNVLDIVNIEDFFQYPPLTLIVHLPTLLWPGPDRMGLIDFYPSFFIIHIVIDFYTFYRLWKAGYYGTGISLWVFFGALFAMLDFSNFISIPIMFIVLTYLNMDNAKKSALYIGLGVATYTYLVIPAIFFLIYHYGKDKWNGLKSYIIGLIPAILVILPFLLWNPQTFINDIFISQGTRVSGNFLHPYNNLPGENTYWWMHLFSIPPYLNTIYNLIINPSVPLFIPHLTLVLTGLVLLLTVYYLYKFYKNPFRGKLVYYTLLMTFAIILVSAAGYAHLLALPVTILIFAWDLRKEIFIDEYQGDFKPPVVRHQENNIKIKEK